MRILQRLYQEVTMGPTSPLSASITLEHFSLFHNNNMVDSNLMQVLSNYLLHDTNMESVPTTKLVDWVSIFASNGFAQPEIYNKIIGIFCILWFCALDTTL